MNPLSAYRIHFSVVISKYGDPVHDDGMKLTQMYKRRVAPLFDVIDKQWKAYKNKPCVLQGLVGLCVSSKIKPNVVDIFIEDQYPELEEDEGGGQGHKERFKCTININFVMHITSESEEGARGLANQEITEIVDNMDCDLCEYADDFGYNGISEVTCLGKVNK
jgi:hypothetical protein